MSAKNVIDVIIDGKIYTIGGFESEAIYRNLLHILVVKY